MNYCILDEKYKIAQTIRLMNDFSVSDVTSKFTHPSPYLKDAIYSVVGELLDKGLVEHSTQNNTDKNILNTESVESFKIYHIDIEHEQKQIIFDTYLEQLSSRRIQPGIDGKPRKSNFRLAEKFLNDSKILSDGKKLSDDKKKYSLDSAHRYLGLAQIDEKIAEKSYDARQVALSEAYVRKLYAEYLVEKDPSNCLQAIPQLIKSTKLFRDYNSLDMQRICESQACEILIKQFEKINQSSISQLINFANSVESLSIPQDFCPITFRFTYSQIFNEIQHQIDSSSNIDFTQINDQNCKILNIYKESDNTASIYKLINEARLILFDREGSLDAKLNARDKLHVALSILQEQSDQIEEGERSKLKLILDDYLKSISVYIKIASINNFDFKERLSKLSELKDFTESGLPFYWTNSIDKLLSIVGEIGGKIELLLDLDRETRRNESTTVKDTNKNIDNNERISTIKDTDNSNILYGYSLEDWEIMRESIVNHRSSIMHDHSLSFKGLENKHESSNKDEENIKVMTNHQNSLLKPSIEEEKKGNIENILSNSYNSEELLVKDMENQNSSCRINEKYNNRLNYISKKQTYSLKDRRMTNNMNKSIDEVRQNQIRLLTPR